MIVLIWDITTAVDIYLLTLRNLLIWEVYKRDLMCSLCFCYRMRAMSVQRPNKPLVEVITQLHPQTVLTDLM